VDLLAAKVSGADPVCMAVECTVCSASHGGISARDGLTFREPRPAHLLPAVVDASTGHLYIAAAYWLMGASHSLSGVYT
jgi:hypothetical protein